MTSPIRFYLPSLVAAFCVVLFTSLLLHHERQAVMEDYQRLFNAQLETASVLLEVDSDAVLTTLNGLGFGQLSLHQGMPLATQAGPLLSLKDEQGQPTYGLLKELPGGRVLLVQEHQALVESSHGPARRWIWLLGLSGAVALVLLRVRTRASRLQLQQREALYRQILDHLPVQVRVRDRNGRFLLENRLAAEQAEGAERDLPLADDKAQPIGKAYEAWNGLRQVLGTGGSHESYYSIGHHAGPHYASYRLVAFPIYDAEHVLRSLGTVVVDETRLSMKREALRSLTADLENQVEQRTQELAGARDEAQAAARSKADFLAKMSHEIRSPLNALMGLAHLAEQANSDAKVQTYLSKILKSAGHLQVVINGVLDFSKINAGKMQLEPVAFSPALLLEELADIYHERAQAKGLALVVDIDPHLPGQLLGDPVRIAQVLHNFTDNAIKFTRVGLVSVRAGLLEQREGNWCVRFEVQDSGVGIAPEQLERVFEAFEQERSVSGQGGTGLGLAISQQLASLMGGVLDARSQPGLGSLFSLNLCLPSAEQGVEVGGRTARELCLPGKHTHANLAGKHVLLVENESLNQEVARELLQALGIYVSLASNGQEALDLLALDPSVDLILMDVQMPVMDGLEATRQLRLSRPTVPVIAMTGNSLPGDREHCLAAGMNDYLSKPILPCALAKTLERWLARSADPMPAQEPTQAPPIAIDGLDVNAALERLMGNAELYQRLLMRFLADYAEVDQSLKAAIDAGRWQQASEQAHSFKSIAATLGADYLQALTCDLEQALLAENAEAQWQLFAAELQRLRAAINDALHRLQPVAAESF